MTMHDDSVRGMRVSAYTPWQYDSVHVHHGVRLEGNRQLSFGFGNQPA